MISRSTPWLVRQAGASRRIRLFCFPYAGGSASSFARWQAALGPTIEACAVQLPGRGARMEEQALTSMQRLVEQMGEVVAQAADLPFAFFGHSLGGLLAFELARHCEQRGLPVPFHIFVSGCHAPRHRRRLTRHHELPDDALIEVLKGFDGTPVEVLQNRELMELVLPTIRADFKLVADYEYRPSEPLRMPITVLAGRNDSFDSEEQVSGWHAETTGPCHIHWFVGGHFFIHSLHSDVLDCVRSRLS